MINSEQALTQLPARVVIGRALAEQGRQVRFYAAVYLLVGACFPHFRLEHLQPFFAALTAYPFHGTGADAQHGGQFRGGAAPALLVAVQNNLNVTKLRRLAFVFLLPPLQGLAFVGGQVKAI